MCIRDSYKTMELISKKSFPTDGSCETVVIARGNEFPDALAASGLAGTLGAQVLITETDELTDETKAEIKRLGAKRAVVLGNEYSISARTFNEIKSLVGGNAERIGGAERFETALEIYKAGEGWGTTAVVATGTKAADSLSISPIAYNLRDVYKRQLLPLCPQRFRTPSRYGLSQAARRRNPALLRCIR